MSVICSSSSRLSSYRISSHGLKRDAWIQSTPRGGRHEGASLQTPLRAGGGASEEVLRVVGEGRGRGLDGRHPCSYPGLEDHQANGLFCKKQSIPP